LALLNEARSTVGKCFGRRQMIKHTWTALAAALCCFATPAGAASPDEVQVATKQLPGNDSDQKQVSYLPLTRKLHAWGVVVGSLTASTEAAGVPPVAMTEALQALATAIDAERDVKGGDLFWVQYEQKYTVGGDPIGTGRVLWAELRTAAKGTVAIHRFRIGKSSAEPFWLATGHSTETPAFHMPLNPSRIVSGFGLRVDPFDQPTSAARTKDAVRITSSGKPKSTNMLGKAKPAAAVQAQAMKMRAGAGPTPLGLSMGLSPLPSGGAAAPSGVPVRAIARRATLVMHQGVDFAAELGTAVHAAADGVVTGAASNGGYGNCIEIEHEEKLSTLYGHLSSFAPGIAPGVHVKRGDLIGFVGNTGRSTGPHLHFELWSNGKPTNPVSHPSMNLPHLSGSDLERFREVVARNLAEAQREGKPQ
jgi:murein DD-endopeptidase MepM/ murein hydrolase activator NlpD